MESVPLVVMWPSFASFPIRGTCVLAAIAQATTIAMAFAASPPLKDFHNALWTARLHQAAPMDTHAFQGDMPRTATTVATV